MSPQNVTVDTIMRPGSEASTLHGRCLILARSVWSVLVVFSLGLFFAAVPALYAQGSSPSRGVRKSLAQLGLSTGFYAVYVTGLLIFFALVCFVVAAVISWRKPDDRMTMLASLLLVLLGGTNHPNMQALVEARPALSVVATFFVFLAFEALILFLFLFPDGRFVPRWMRVPMAVWSAALLVGWFLPGSSLPEPSDLAGLLILIALPAGAITQVYRYRRVSDHAQRQQTKWVVFGITAAVVGQSVFWVLGEIAPTALSPGSVTLVYDLIDLTGVTLSYLFIPLAIGVAILRYRLWDIDVIINRALVYSALTACVVVAYVLVVGSLGVMFRTEDSFLISLLATGLVAVVFAPVRERLQRGVNRLMYGERDDPYAVISRLGERQETAVAPNEMLRVIVETVKEALRVPYAAISLREGDDAGRISAEAGEPVERALRLPLTYQREPVGELLLGPRVGSKEFSAADRRLLEDLARQAGVAAHSVLLTRDLQRSREKLVTAREEERRRLRRDLHDGLGAQLAGLNVQTGVLRRLIPQDPAAADELAAELKTELRSAIADIRRLVYDLRPPALDDLGLVAALTQLATRYGADDGELQVTVAAPDSLPHLPAAVEVAVYRIAQEALTNVIRHARARTCVVRISVDDGMRLEIADNGVGVPEESAAGVGLLSMRERAAELGGTCAFRPRPEGGTQVLVRLPLPGEE